VRDTLSAHCRDTAPAAAAAAAGFSLAHLSLYLLVTLIASLDNTINDRPDCVCSKLLTTCSPLGCSFLKKYLRVVRKDKFWLHQAGKFHFTADLT